MRNVVAYASEREAKLDLESRGCFFHIPLNHALSYSRNNSTPATLTLSSQQSALNPSQLLTHSAQHSSLPIRFLCFSVYSCVAYPSPFNLHFTLSFTFSFSIYSRFPSSLHMHKHLPLMFQLRHLLKFNPNH